MVFDQYLKEGTFTYINERTQPKDLYFDWIKDCNIIPECVVITAGDILDSTVPIAVFAFIINL